MFRRIFILMITLLMLPCLSLAEEKPVYEAFTFSGSLPQQLKEPLSALIPDESKILSGAAVQHNSYPTNTPQPSYDTSYSALVLVSTDAGLRLYAAAQPEGMPWAVSDYTRFLRQQKNVSISIYKPEVYRIPVLSVDYAAQGGLISDLISFRNNQIWCIWEHINSVHHISIINNHGSLTIKDSEGRTDYVSASPFCLDYMESIADFPITHAEAAAQEATVLTDFPAAGSIAYASAANLRREPTGKSESLGIYAANTPMILTGEQAPGTSLPWYQVRIGNTVGWMSSNYVNHYADYGLGPVPLGRTSDGCPMYANPGDTQQLQQLEPGTTFHILTEYKDMYHICIPQGQISWAVDLNGLYGYIPKDGVLTGYSPTALDALVNAR